MADTYLDLVNSGLTGTWAKKLGLPRPAVLRRHTPGDPLLDGPVLVLGRGGDADALARLLVGPAGGAPGPLGVVPRDRLNVHGSSLAAGHPFAATGGRIVAGVATALHERRAAQLAAGDDSPVRALVSVCAAGGLGMAAILEAV